MNHTQLLALLLPPGSYAPSGPTLLAELTAEGEALDAALAATQIVTGAITPFFTEQLLPDWERVCGITTPAGATYQQRLQVILTKLAETGGLSIPYFTRLALALGYQITIEEPGPFRAGESRAGDRLMPWPDTLWYWRVIVASDHENTTGDAVIEAVFNELKPAHTLCGFFYQGARRLTETGDDRVTESDEPRRIEF